jgi:hypothetical protein
MFSELFSALPYILCFLFFCPQNPSFSGENFLKKRLATVDIEQVFWYNREGFYALLFCTS